MQQITPFLWYDGKAEEATSFYLSIFKNSRLISTMKNPDGSVMGTTFELNGLELTAFNGGPLFSFTPAISLFVNCETQDEVDHYWERLSEGGSQERCGWLKDPYGLSWQIVPNILSRLLQDEDRAKAQQVMQAMLQMDKLDIAALKHAAEL